MSTAPSLSENLPLWRISSKSSPPLQILSKTRLGQSNVGHLLSDEVVTLLVLKELVHLDDVGVILEKKSCKYFN